MDKFELDKEARRELIEAIKELDDESLAYYLNNLDCISDFTADIIDLVIPKYNDELLKLALSWLWFAADAPDPSYVNRPNPSPADLIEANIIQYLNGWIRYCAIDELKSEAKVRKIK